MIPPFCKGKRRLEQFSPGYRLLMCQSLMTTLGGPLELLEVNGKLAVCCSIPLAHLIPSAQ